ncbi:hypothetical protein [Endothiovibrio diazotrophicus]
MSTVNFSVPEEVKQAFNTTFQGRNKSAVIAELMIRAVEEERTRQRRAAAIDAILELREQIEPLSAETVRAAREEGRP